MYVYPRLLYNLFWLKPSIWTYCWEQCRRRWGHIRSDLLFLEAFLFVLLVMRRLFAPCNYTYKFVIVKWTEDIAGYSVQFQTYYTIIWTKHHETHKGGLLYGDLTFLSPNDIIIPCCRPLGSTLGNSLRLPKFIHISLSLLWNPRS